MNGEYLLNVSSLIDDTVQDIIDEFVAVRGDDPSDYETDAYHFVDTLDEWLEENRDFVECHILDPDLIAKQWLDEHGKRMIRERIQYLG